MSGVELAPAFSLGVAMGIALDGLLALPDAIAVASPARLEELCRIVVAQVVIRNREIQAIDWTPPARPFFAKKQRACPQGDSNP